MIEADLETRIRGAWQGRITGCLLGKAVEMLSMREGFDALQEYLQRADALPLRDYIPLLEGTPVWAGCCRGHITHSEPDDDIHYTTLALIMLEAHGTALTTEDVARTWLNYLPVGMTFTAERAAYRILLNRAHEWFPQGREPGFDISECSDNPYNDWIGAQIRADLYGWVTPGNATLATQLATQDAQLSHRGDGISGAVFVAALGAEIPVAESLVNAITRAKTYIPQDSGAAEAIELGMSCAGDAAGPAAIRDKYASLSPVHTLNNLGLVVWALLTHTDDFGAAIGDVVAAGLDTDCNGATVGALWGLQGKPIPEPWLRPWQGKVALALAGHDTLQLSVLVDRTVNLAKTLSAGR